MDHKKKIAIMTSGGDSPGMSPFVRAAVRMGLYMGCDVFCVREGYRGLVEGGDKLEKADHEYCRGWVALGGTRIGTSRSPEFRQREGRMQAAKNMVMNGIDGLIICGGDGSLTGADVFRQEWPGLLKDLVAAGELEDAQASLYPHLNIVGVVGSIDNDMSGTDATIGAFTALARISDMITYIHTTAWSHSRAFVIEVMGRHCGWLALMAGVANGADYIFIPERPSTGDWKDEMRPAIKKNKAAGKRKIIVIVAEGASDFNGNRITAEQVRSFLEHDLGLDARVTAPGHYQRGGPPVAYDRLIGTLQGMEAVRAVLDAGPDTEPCFIAMVENKILRKPLMEAVRLTQAAAKAMEEKDFDRAMSLRDAEFVEYHKALLVMTNVITPEEQKLPKNKRMKIAFVNVGAPAAGMNTAIRAGVARCISQGHEPIAIFNGFTGLIKKDQDDPAGAVRPLQWLEVDDWTSLGGSEIGTNRALPKEVGMKCVADRLEEHQFDALFVIGGFEAFHALAQLRVARSEYPSLCIPMVLLPATISNNVPGTEYSLGSDTCLNELMKYCDTIRQSATSSGQRVFFVETQGGNSGYIATLAGLCVGAAAVYVPEEGVSLDMVSSDLRFLRAYFRRQEATAIARAGRLVMVNEKASSVYTAGTLADIFANESEDLFDTRSSIPGHMQQGQVPSAMDACQATRLAIRCIERIEQFGPRAYNRVKEDPLSASVIGIQGSKVVFTPMSELEERSTDWSRRVAMKASWMDVKHVCDVMSGRPEYPKPKAIKALSD